MPDPIAYCNGEFIPQSQCMIAMHDLGIVLGAAVTDFLRTVNGKPYRIDDHLNRLDASCKYARITSPVDANKGKEIAERLIETNLPLYDGSELGLVFYVTAGQNPIYAGATSSIESNTPTYVQHTFPLPVSLWKQWFHDGAHCVTPTPRHWPPACVSSKIKHRNRLHMWIGEQEARLADPAAVPLFLDVNGNITETSGSNFVVYRKGQVVSPRRANILWGVSLNVLEQILKNLNIPFIEDDLQTYDVINADEAWMPSTPYFLAPVTKINGLPIGNGTPGPIWRKALARWSQEISKDIHEEIAHASDDDRSLKHS